MYKKRVEITLKFSADLDMVPGWGHVPVDWVEYVKHRLAGNDHYHTQTEVVSVATKE